jgi:hypothetical protein
MTPPEVTGLQRTDCCTFPLIGSAICMENIDTSVNAALLNRDLLGGDDPPVRQAAFLASCH